MNADRFECLSPRERDWIAQALVNLATEIMYQPRARPSDPPIQDLIALAHEADGILSERENAKV
jgi:hypothetical protein